MQLMKRDRPGPGSPRVLVVGAGVGGLVTAALLARQGLSVRVLERAAAPGGKLSQRALGPLQLDAGPTVLTMRWVFDALFEALDLVFDARVSLRRCEVLARHAWGAQTLDLLADPHDSAEAIAALAGPREGQRYLRFCRQAEAVFQTLDQPFLRSSRPNPLSLSWRVGLHRLPALLAIRPFRSLWRELEDLFEDPRLRQLFGRYATYCGSSPFEAPATLMLVAHVERCAVWQLEGGMHALLEALLVAAQRQGVQLSCGQGVAEIGCDARGVRGLRLDSGEWLEAEAVVFNGDVQALELGLLGPAARGAVTGRAGAVPRAASPSLSALTWHLEAEASGFELSHHNVFFSAPQQQGYRREFAALAAGRLPPDPTVYVCAQDRQGLRRPRPGQLPAGPERLMCLVNAPAQRLGPGGLAGEGQVLSSEEIEACEQAMWRQLAAAGLRLKPGSQAVLRTGPAEFAQRYPGSGGALYGRASQGWRSAFQRPAQRSRIPGLYLAGGTAHPGPGVPMAALSGQLAAQQLLEDLASTSRSRLVAMPGGISTP